MSSIPQFAVTSDARSHWEHLGSTVDRHSRLILFILSAFYAVLSFLQATSRPLWHDEIYTFYIAQAPNLSRLIYEIRAVDLNPPLVYLLTRLSIDALGPGLFATRLPEVLGFYLASICLYIFVKRKTSAAFGFMAVLSFWAIPFFLAYATEARPYGIVLGFFGLVMIAWQRSIEGGQRTGWLLLIGLGVAGMLMSHIFAVLMLSPFLIAECVRLLRTRSPDFPLWASFCAPLVLMVTYIPLVQRYEAGAYPPAFQGSLTRALTFLLETSSPDAFVVLIALLAALAIGVWAQGEKRRFPLSVSECGFIVGLFLVPLIVSLVLRHSHGAYFPRYAIVSGLAVPILLAVLCAFYSGAGSLPAVAACIILSLWITNTSILRVARHAVPEAKIDKLSPDLPLVTASGLTFLEMDRREQSGFLSRVYYLTDVNRAIRYSHATIFEGLPLLKQLFPIRANVTPYMNFIKTHREFLVLGTPGYPEDWLIPCLEDSGAVLQYVGDYAIPYKDKTIFKVILPPASDR